jgi:hypothetical protein
VVDWSRRKDCFLPTTNLRLDPSKLSQILSPSLPTLLGTSETLIEQSGPNGRWKSPHRARRIGHSSSSAYALSKQEIPFPGDSEPRRSGVSLSYVDCIWHVSLCDVCMILRAGIHRMFQGLGSTHHYTLGVRNFVREGWLSVRNMAVSYLGRGPCCRLSLALSRFTTDRTTHYRTGSLRNTFVCKTARNSALLQHQTQFP